MKYVIAALIVGVGLGMQAHTLTTSKIIIVDANSHTKVVIGVDPVTGAGYIKLFDAHGKASGGIGNKLDFKNPIISQQDLLELAKGKENIDAEKLREELIKLYVTLVEITAIRYPDN